MAKAGCAPVLSPGGFDRDGDNATREKTIDALRSKLRVVGSGVPEVAPRRGIAVPPWLGEHIGALPRAAVTAMNDVPAVVVQVLAAVTAAGGCAAVVNYPGLALAAVAAAGGDVERLVVIPDATPHTSAVLGTLVEGMDLVLFAPEGTVAPGFARPVEARVHKSQCALVVCGGKWPKARVHVECEVLGVTGLGRGTGRVRGVRLRGRVWGRALPPRTFEAELGSRWDAARSGAGASAVEVAQ